MILSFSSMFLFVVIVLISIQTGIDSKSNAQFCTETKWDYEVNRLQSIFTIKDKVYIRVGTAASKLWVYDTKSRTILEQPVMASDIFPNWNPIVEFVATVLCKPTTNCDPYVDNLIIVIGRRDLRSHHGFATFRLQNDGSITKIEQTVELPSGWGLRFGEGEFSINADPYWGFFPERVVTEKINSSNFHGFAFIPSNQMFSMKYYNEDGRFFMYRRIGGWLPHGIEPDWSHTGIGGSPHVLNSLFTIDDQIYSIDNDPQYMPRISHRIIINQTNKINFMIENIDIDARDFFNCYDPTPPPTPPPTTAETTAPPTTPSTESPSTTVSIDTVSSISSESTQSPTTGVGVPVVTSDVSSTIQTTIQRGSTTTGKTDGTLVSTTNNPDHKRDFITFLIIFFLIMLLILIGIICLVLYFMFANKKKGDQYYNPEEVKSHRSRAAVRTAADGAVSDGRDSRDFGQDLTTMRSMNPQNEEPVGQKVDQSEDRLSTNSMRSLNDPKTEKPPEGSGIESEGNQSVTSLRSNNPKTEKPLEGSGIESEGNQSLASLRSNRN